MMKKTASKTQTQSPKKGGNLAVQIDWSDFETCDVISLYACKRIALRDYAKASPKKTITLHVREGESCDFGGLPRRVIYYAAINSAPLVEKLEKQLKNAGFDTRLCYASINEDWEEEAIIKNSEVMWNLN